ncbi:MAG: type II secretion system F family protein [Patescibacteria group bacterium]
MPKFLYKAKNSKGEIVTGTVKASTSQEAENILVKHNLVATELIIEKRTSWEKFSIRKVSARDKAVFSRQMATMLNAGLSLTKTVSVIAKQTQSDKIRQIFLDVYNDLEEGYSLSSAMSRHPEAFDRVYVSVVNSGEATGKLDLVLNEMANELENDSQFMSKVKSSLYYPAFILICLIAAGIFMLTFVIPKLKSMFESAQQQLPILTRILIFVSNALVNWWWLIIILFIGIVIAVRFWSTTEAGARFMHNMQLTLPGISTIFTGMYMYRFNRILSMLIGAGVPLLDALRIAGSVINNVVYEESIMNVAAQVEKGVALSNQLEKEAFFPPLVSQMVAVGEETGELDKILSKLADYYEQSTNDVTKAISSVIEPAVLVLVGIGVAFMVFAIYLPIYQLNQVIS